MTEQTVRSVAKKLAGNFYDDPARSELFRKSFPTFKNFIRGQCVKENDIVIMPPGWVYFIKKAREAMATLLRKSDAEISPYLKDCISEALKEDHSRAISPQAKSIIQRVN